MTDTKEKDIICRNNSLHNNEMPFLVPKIRWGEWKIWFRIIESPVKFRLCTVEYCKISFEICAVFSSLSHWKPSKKVLMPCPM